MMAQGSSSRIKDTPEDGDEDAPERAPGSPQTRPYGSDAEARAAQVVKICKACMTSQTGDAQFCVQCGAGLTAIRSVDESYVGQTVGGKFKIVDFIDRGGMGEVYLGRVDPLGQRVAVKFLNKRFTSDKSIVDRFLNEARSYCRVHHPNAVTMLEYGQHDDGALYIVTEFIEGKSLSKTIKEHGPFSPEQTIAVGLQCCEVMAAAHGEGVIHRDLKPDNLMMIPAGKDGRRFTIKVLDFGIAKITDDDAGPMTETGAIFGTPEFMSPEQARGDGADPRSDLYALGIILFYMLTGRLPFSGKNKFAILNKHLHDAPPRPSELAPERNIPLALEAVILKLLNKSPAQRYASADDLYEALDEVRGVLAGGGGGSGTTPPLTGRQSPPSAVSGTVELGGSRSRLGSDFGFEDDPDDEALPDPHADTLAPQDTAPKRLDDELDMSRGLSSGGSRGRPTPDVEPGPTFETTGRKRSAAAWMAAGLFLGLTVMGAYLAWHSMEHVGPTEPEQHGAGAAAGEPVDMQRALVTGQVLGLLSSAEDAMERGELVSLKRNLETTHLWMKDAELPEEARTRRQALERGLTELSALLEQGEAARAQQTCDKLLHVSSRMRPYSELLYKQWRADAMTCMKAAKEPAAAPVKPADPVPVQPLKQPDPVKPEVIKPADPVKPPDPVKPADPVKPPEQAPDADPTPDDGLPPRQL
jgi:eukaryotic-like serine/threonine-protein kinase